MRNINLGSLKIEDCPSCIKTSGGQHFYLHIFFSELRTYTRLLFYSNDRLTTLPVPFRGQQHYTHTLAGSLHLSAEHMITKLKKKIFFCKYLFLLTLFLQGTFTTGWPYHVVRFKIMLHIAVKKKTCICIHSFVEKEQYAHQVNIGLPTQSILL